MNLWASIVVAVIMGSSAQPVDYSKIFRDVLTGRKEIFTPKPPSWKPVPNEMWSGTDMGRKTWYKFKPHATGFEMAMSYDKQKWTVPPYQSWHDKNGKLVRLTWDKRIEISDNDCANWANVSERSWVADDGMHYKVDENGKLWRR